MIRNDFVSNSSSSSFIVSAEDNKYGIIWHNSEDIDKCNITEVVNSIFNDYRLQYMYLDINRNITYIEDEKYSKNFSVYIRGIYLPASCTELVDLYKSYMTVYKKMKESEPTTNTNNKINKNIKDREKILEDIRKKILKLVHKEWKDVVFHYITINDYFIDDMYDIFECQNNVELIDERIEYLNSIKPFRFLFKH